VDRSGGKCPFCGSLEIVPVIYGYAPFDILLQAGRGEVALGGMCIEEGQPQWKCNSCGRMLPGEAGDP
jgi:hypothetical protein